MSVGATVGTTRILMVDVPRLMVGVIEGIVAQDRELEIVGGTDAAGMLGAIDRLQPHVVVFGGDVAPPPSLIGSLKRLHEHLRVVTLERAGSSATVYEHGAPSREIAELSPEALLDMFRSLH